MPENTVDLADRFQDIPSSQSLGRYGLTHHQIVIDQLGVRLLHATVRAQAVPQLPYRMRCLVCGILRRVPLRYVDVKTDHTIIGSDLALSPVRLFFDSGDSVHAKNNTVAAHGQVRGKLSSDQLIFDIRHYHLKLGSLA